MSARSVRPTKSSMRFIKMLLALGAVNALLFGCSTQAQAPEWADTPVGRAVRTVAAVRTPIVVSRVAPDYPKVDRENGTHGLVRVEVVINEAGAGIHSQILEAPSASLAEAAVKAVERWRFSPTVVEGQPVKVLFPVAINFQN